MDDRIKLAEAMGWHLFNGHWQPGTVSPEKCQELLDAGNYHINWGAYDLPDPFTDANDCEALIKHIESLGYEIHMGSTFNDVQKKRERFVWFDNERHSFDSYADDWKQAVCELALKVIDQ